MFSQEHTHTQVDREEMEEYMGPAAIDGFVGVADEIDVETLEVDAQAGRYPIPPELLMQLSIADITKDTRIIHLTTGTVIGSGDMSENGAGDPMPGPSGIENETRTMEMDVPEPIMPVPDTSNTIPNPAGPSTEPEVTVQRPKANTLVPTVTVSVPNAKPSNQQFITKRVNALPKKGYNTKNKRNDIVEPLPQEKDDNVETRLRVLSEIADIVKKSGEKRNMSEFDVWGQYIGMKVARVEEAHVRDKVVIKVERIITEAIHGEWDMEE